MNNQTASFLSLYGLVVALGILSATVVKAEAVQWPAGKNVCQGVWSYSEYQSCEDASHGPDVSRPIIADKDGPRCGYEKKQNSCWHGREHNIHDFIDTTPERLERDTRDYTPQDLQAHCEQKGRGMSLRPQQLLGTVSVLSSKIYARLCSEMEGRICIMWRFRADVQCRINFDYQIFGPSDDCGTYIDDLTKPKTCVVGHHNINKRSSACQSIDQKTGRSTDASALMQETWRHGFACSTGDDLPAETADEVQKKFNFLVKKIQEFEDPKQADFGILTGALSALLTQRSQFLDEAQISYASKVASKEIKISKISEGIAFDVAKECASNGSGQSRFCPSKRIVFDFDDTSHLPLIASFTSIAHKLKYSFPCDATVKQLSVRLIEGDDEFSLAPTPVATMQSTSIVHVPGQRPPQIEIVADRNAFISDSCQLNIEWSSLDLDPTLLYKTTKDLIDKLKLLAKFKTELGKASQLSTKYNTVKALKSSVEDSVTEDIFGCQDLASAAGRDVDGLCPLNDDPTWACSNASLTETGELGVIIRRLHHNSCLYKGLVEGLPETVPCNSTGTSSGSQCLAGIQKVAGIATEEYEKSRASADDLQKALASEWSRVALKEPDIARKIKIVIDSLNKELAESSSPVSPFRSRR
jgi:hypothetical protein